jgi:hypothetical protein
MQEETIQHLQMAEVEVEPLQVVVPVQMVVTDRVHIPHGVLQQRLDKILVELDGTLVAEEVLLKVLDKHLELAVMVAEDEVVLMVVQLQQLVGPTALAEKVVLQTLVAVVAVKIK